ATITRSTGSFITDGFVAGDEVHVGGGTPYDGNYTIASRTATVLTLAYPLGATNDTRTGVSIATQYTIAIDHVFAGGNVDLQLRASATRSGSATAGGVDIYWASHSPGGPYYSAFKGPGAQQTLAAGVYGSGHTTIASTYDFRRLDDSGLPTLPGL